MSDLTNLAARFERLNSPPADGSIGPGNAALIVGGRSVARTELFERVGRWRGALLGAGVRSGDRVVVVAANSEEFVVAHLAAMGIGAISVPLNPQSPPAELAREIDVVTPTAAVADSAGDPGLSAALDQVSGSTVARLAVTALDAGPPSPIVEVAGDAVACLIFTSGTAGPPKPAMLTHDNLTAGLQAVLSLPVSLIGGQHVIVGLIPLFHVFGLNIVLHLGLLIGATVVLDDFVDAETTARLIAEHRCTFVPGPPTLWQALLHAADPEQLATVEIALAGASKLRPELKVAVAERLGVDVTEGYGLTESSAVVASSIGSDPPLGSVGRLLPGVEGRIVDQQGADCLVGDPGELLVRGPMVFPGYWGPNGSSGGGPGPLDGDGWLHTGDVAVVDDDGNLAIVDRLKDLIIVSGFNVYPVEVEAVLRDHPDVAEVAVVSEPAETTGETVVAHIVARPGATIDTDEVLDHCRGQLARYKTPSRLVVVDQLPFGPTGKLQRNRLT